LVAKSYLLPQASNFRLIFEKDQYNSASSNFRMQICRLVSVAFSDFIIFMVKERLQSNTDGGVTAAVPQRLWTAKTRLGTRKP
jgi:hypothetical protein